MSQPTTIQGKPDYTALSFPDPPGDRPTVIVNMVMSADGKARIGDTEQGLGSDADQRLMRELRSHADVVLNGSGTLRTSGASPRLNDDGLEGMRTARGQPRLPIAAVISRSGDLPLESEFFTAEDFEAVVYLSERAPAERRRAIEATGRSVVSVPGGDEFRAMLGHMRRELGARLVLAEGGPALNGSLFAQGLVDEYFVTIGGLVVGGDDPLTTVESPTDALTRLRLLSVSANPEDSEIYLHYAAIASPGDAPSPERQSP